MRFRFHRHDALPRLAWCASLRRRDATVDVHHGPWVEVAADWFVEGAWDGDFGIGEVASGFLMGSGARLTGDGVVFAAPSHTLERLHLLRRGDVLFVSNSLVFVLAAAGDGLDPNHTAYRQDFESVIRGLDRYVRSLPTRAGRRVDIVYHANVAVDRDLAVHETPKAPVKEFASFADYTGFLEGTVAAIQRNAVDLRRRHTYQPATTISSGYDSPACAVLANQVGCAEALVFRHSRYQRQAVRALDDSGAPIAAALGMQVYDYDRSEYLRRSGFPEAEFLASGPEGGDVVMAAWEDRLPGRLLFTGFQGDRVWDRNAPVSAQIVRGHASGTTLTEFRLRVGFIHFPVAFLGCTSHRSIVQVSNSEEMRPWTLGTDYDRPIPRRLVESRGIERRAFGQDKKAVTAPLLPELTERMTEMSRRDFRAFYRQHRRAPERALDAAWLRAAALYTRLAYGINAVLAAGGVRTRVRLFVPAQLRYPRGSASLLNHWGVERTRSRYAVAGEPTPAAAVETG
jgi:hypothetical protein